MSYIKEFYKLVFPIPENGFLILNHHADSGTYIKGTDLNKPEFGLRHVESEEWYVKEMLKSLSSVETGYIRKGFSIAQCDDRMYSDEEYMAYQHEIFKRPFPLDLFFKYYLVHFELYFKDGVSQFEELISKLGMTPSTPYHSVLFDELKNSYRVRLKDIETLLYILEHYHYAYERDYIYTLEVSNRYKRKRIWNE